MASQLDSFPQFRRLAPEIRRMIWDASLPKYEKGALFPLDRASDFLVEGVRAKVQVATPQLYYVNHEAREATEDWIKQRNIDVLYSDEKKAHILFRNLDLNQDIAYMTHEGSRLLNFNAWETKWDLIKRIAMPVKTSMTIIRSYSAIRDIFPSICEVNIIAEPVPTIKTLVTGPASFSNGEHIDSVVALELWELDFNVTWSNHMDDMIFEGVRQDEVPADLSCAALWMGELFDYFCRREVLMGEDHEIWFPFQPAEAIQKLRG